MEYGVFAGRGKYHEGRFGLLHAVHHQCIGFDNASIRALRLSQGHIVMSAFSAALHAEASSFKPLSRIPERRSSRLFHTSTDTGGVSSTFNPPQPTVLSKQALKPPAIVTARGKSASPIKRRSTISDGPRTFVPNVLPKDILDLPKLAHPRVQLDVRLFAPLAVGGATVEGETDIKIDANCAESKRHTLPLISVHRISACVIGVEKCRDRREIFHALTTHLLHVNELPLIGDATKTFSVDLPMHVGPPPYKSKKASITYLLSVLVEFRIAEKTHFVRQTNEIEVLSVHDRMSRQSYIDFYS